MNCTFTLRVLKTVNLARSVGLHDQYHCGHNYFHLFTEKLLNVQKCKIRLCFMTNKQSCECTHSEGTQ